MNGHEKLICIECQHYESYHKYPNPNATARHYCKKCKTEDCFENWEYGVTKVCVGDSNKYVIDRYGETKYYLYLTKETLQSFTMQREVIE